MKDNFILDTFYKTFHFNKDNKIFKDIERFLIKNQKFSICSLSPFLKVFLGAYISNRCQNLENLNKKKIIYVTDSEQKCIKYSNDLFNISNIEAKIFPSQDSGIYDTVLRNFYKYQEQVEILDTKPDFVITSIKSLLEKFPSKTFFHKYNINLALNQKKDPQNLALDLINLGYKRVTMVNDIGEFSLRGDILDVFTLYKNPLRIEFWDDNIQDLRFFNQENQKSIEKVKNVSISPLFKAVIPTLEEDKFLYDDDINNQKDQAIFQIFESIYNDELKNIVELLADDYIFIFDESCEILSKYEKIDRSYLQSFEDLKLNELENNNLKQNLKLNHVQYGEFLIQLNKIIRINFDNFSDFEQEIVLDFDESQNLPLFSSHLDELSLFVQNKIKDNFNIVIATDYKNRIKEVFNELEVDYSNIKFINNITSGGILSVKLNLLVLTDKELFNKISKDVAVKKYGYHKEKQDYIDSINDIQEGDYIVHRIHGVGLYLGLSKQEFDGQYKDYLSLEYANGDKLHIPAEQINFLYRYRGSGSQKPKLSKMGGTDWQLTKNKAKKAVEDIARDLINLYARRKISKGIKFEEDTIWQYEMEESFPFTETPDQMKAIIDTKADMESEKPMDRLICADVGFGKTEIAIRAIFKAVLSLKQAALIVPTTILALQHFKTISERFKPYPIKIELLSRFKSLKEQKEILKKLAIGEIDLVIATHRLLQKDVIFKNLGLLVIDEEHRFGVKDKEKLKNMRKNIDILSMSATPIPRTLYMSLSGIKDISVINTAPMNRLPIKTYVTEQKDKTIINAINYEVNRDGQVFILYNRVETIYEFASYIQNLVPNIRIQVAHGQLDKKYLEKIMADFANKEFDVLIATTIIESGLDINNANTILICDSYKFGLAQLYQLRGRVGRSDRQAYCYCFYKNANTLTPEAIKRLKTIKDFTTLGSGYQIALRDIEIRGVGNILGTKQHGHMINVGFDAYCQLLDQAINELKGEKVKQETQAAIIDIKITAFIPDNWVGSKEQKMIEYKRLADINSIADIDLIELEWKDRFSKLPQEVENLIKLIKLRILATEANISLVRESVDDIRIYTPFTKKQWDSILTKLPQIVKKNIKFTIAPKTIVDTNSILLFNSNYKSFNEIFNILSNMFYIIKESIKPDKDNG